MQEKQSMDVGTCPVKASHETTACVPVSICPFAEPGEICIENCGAPDVNCGGEPCCGVVNGRFEFTITQKMKINIPIVFGADIAVGEAYIQNGKTVGNIEGDCSCDCEKCEHGCMDCEEDEPHHEPEEEEDATDTDESDHSAFAAFQAMTFHSEDESI